MPGIEPGASYMQSMRSTTELHPRCNCEDNCDFSDPPGIGDAVGNATKNRWVPTARLELAIFGLGHVGLQPAIGCPQDRP